MAQFGHPLSRREVEVLDLVVQGLSSEDVGAKLFVTEKTVKFHLTHVYIKLGVKSRAEAIVKVLTRDLSEANQALLAMKESLRPSKREDDALPLGINSELGKL